MLMMRKEKSHMMMVKIMLKVKDINFMKLRQKLGKIFMKLLMIYLNNYIKLLEVK